MFETSVQYQELGLAKGKDTGHNLFTFGSWVAPTEPLRGRWMDAGIDMARSTIESPSGTTLSPFSLCYLELYECNRLSLEGCAAEEDALDMG